MDQTDDKFMGRALALARVAQARGLSPIGAVIAIDGKVVAEGHNEVDLQCDPTAHAEIVAMRRLAQARNTTECRGAVLYSTLQPCGMCTLASVWAKVSRIVYGAGSADVHRMYFEDRHVRTLELIADAYRGDITVTAGVLRAECASLYYKPCEHVPISKQANI